MVDCLRLCTGDGAVQPGGEYYLISVYREVRGYGRRRSVCPSESHGRRCRGGICNGRQAGSDSPVHKTVSVRRNRFNRNWRGRVLLKPSGRGDCPASDLRHRQRRLIVQELRLYGAVYTMGSGEFCVRGCQACAGYCDGSRKHCPLFKMPVGARSRRDGLGGLSIKGFGRDPS